MPEYDIGTRASLETIAFVDVFRALGEKTKDHSRLRKYIFSEIDSGRGKVRLDDLNEFIASALKQKYGDEEGQEIFELFSPCYRHAYESAKLLKRNRVKQSISTYDQDEDDNISFTEFRIFTVFLCIYAAMFDIFSMILVQNEADWDAYICEEGEEGQQREEEIRNKEQQQKQQRFHDNDIQMTLEEFLHRYESARSHGFSISTDLSTGNKATALFNRIDTDKRGYIYFSEWIEYIKKDETRRKTNLGALLCGKIKPSITAVPTNVSKPSSAPTLSIQHPPKLPSGRRPFSPKRVFHTYASTRRMQIGYDKIKNILSRRASSSKGSRKK